MSDGMSDARDYGPSLSKHGRPIVSNEGKPVPICMVQTGCLGVVCGKLLPCEDHTGKCEGCGKPASTVLCQVCFNSGEFQ
jgi:hypothetical protein